MRLKPNSSPAEEQGKSVMIMTSWNALTIQMESDEDTCNWRAMVGNATLQIVPSITVRNKPDRMAAIA